MTWDTVEADTGVHPSGDILLKLKLSWSDLGMASQPSPTKVKHDRPCGCSQHLISYYCVCQTE